MKLNLIVIDDFYQDPDSVRKFALEQDFSVKGNYPGVRTAPFMNDSIKTLLSDIVAFGGGKVTKWHDYEGGYCGCYQLCTAAERTWIHADTFNTWAGVCYLTPDAPLSGGTAIYKHKRTGNIRCVGSQYEACDMTKWELVDRIGNLYNRLVLYRGDLFHSSIDYFGSGFDDGRLFQTFFFDTEY